MPLILARPKNGKVDVLIVLGSDNVERIKEKDPLQMHWREFPFWQDRIGVIGISYASDAEMTQLTQLARQGKTLEAIKIATSGWKYRPEKGDHDLGPEKF